MEDNAVIKKRKYVDIKHNDSEERLLKRLSNGTSNSGIFTLLQIMWEYLGTVETTTWMHRYAIVQLIMQVDSTVEYTGAIEETNNSFLAVQIKEYLCKVDLDQMLQRMASWVIHDRIAVTGSLITMLAHYGSELKKPISGQSCSNVIGDIDIFCRMHVKDWQNHIAEEVGELKGCQTIGHKTEYKHHMSGIESMRRLYKDDHTWYVNWVRACPVSFETLEEMVSAFDFDFLMNVYRVDGTVTILHPQSLFQLESEYRQGYSNSDWTKYKRSAWRINLYKLRGATIINGPPWFPLSRRDELKLMWSSDVSCKLKPQNREQQDICTTLQHSSIDTLFDYLTATWSSMSEPSTKQLNQYKAAFWMALPNLSKLNKYTISRHKSLEYHWIGAIGHLRIKYDRELSQMHQIVQHGIPHLPPKSDSTVQTFFQELQLYCYDIDAVFVFFESIFV